MTDPMTTPPLDLTALHARLERAKERPVPPGLAGILALDALALLDRVEEADGLLARLSASGGRNIDLLTRAEAAERDLAAVTVSRDGWKTRAEAAEAAIQRMRDLASDSAFNAQDIYGDLPATEYDDQDHAESLLAVTVRALNHAMDGGA